MTCTAASAMPPEDVDGDARWMDLHNLFVQQANGNEPDVLFLGDSHVAQLGQSEVFRDLFAPLHCLCFGIGGDKTQNLLWRIRNGELEHIFPKVIVILIGSNNRDSASDITAGIRAIVETTREKQPQSCLLILKIPPRGRNPNKLRGTFEEANAGLPAALKHVDNCQVIEIDNGLVSTTDGTINHCDMYDYVHFTNEGFKKALEPLYVAVHSAVNPESARYNDAGDS